MSTQITEIRVWNTLSRSAQKTSYPCRMELLCIQCNTTTIHYLMSSSCVCSNLPNLSVKLHYNVMRTVITTVIANVMLCASLLRVFANVMWCAPLLRVFVNVMWCKLLQVFVNATILCTLLLRVLANAMWYAPLLWRCSLMMEYQVHRYYKSLLML
jgi:hypothetical protein